MPKVKKLKPRSPRFSLIESKAAPEQRSAIVNTTVIRSIISSDRDTALDYIFALRRKEIKPYDEPLTEIVNQEKTEKAFKKIAITGADVEYRVRRPGQEEYSNLEWSEN